jgi:hypothetical protein
MLRDLMSPRTSADVNARKKGALKSYSYIKVYV